MNLIRPFAALFFLVLASVRAADLPRSAPEKQGVASAALLSFIPKVAGFVALVRVLGQPGLEAVGHAHSWSLAAQSGAALKWLAILTMFVGNLLAISQENVKQK